MANCIECGLETDLHEMGAPICPACLTERERLHPVRASLTADLALARALYFEALEEFERCKAALQDFPSGHPERAKYEEALKLYNQTLRKYGKDG